MLSCELKEQYWFSFRYLNRKRTRKTARPFKEPFFPIDGCNISKLQSQLWLCTYHDTAGILLQWSTHCSKNCKNLKIIFICIIFYFTTNLFVFVVLKNFHDIPIQDLIQNIPPGSLYLKILRFCYLILIISFNDFLVSSCPNFCI